MVIEQGVWVGRIVKENGHEPNGKKVDRNCDKMRINSKNTLAKKFPPNCKMTPTEKF